MAGETFVVRAVLELEEGVDPRAPGGAVTQELCGTWEHEGPCAWPHNSEYELSDGVMLFRTVFAPAGGDTAEPGEARAVARRIAAALEGGEWSVVALTLDAVATDAERELGARLASGAG